jgi:MFS family permease
LLVIGVLGWGCVQGVFFTSITALATEQIPELRGVVTAMLSGSTYLGVTLFSPLAVALYERFGFAAVGAVAGLSCAAACALLAWPGFRVAAVEGVVPAERR